MNENDVMRGNWHFTGRYWLCDCYGGAPVLQIGGGQGGSINPGKPQSPNTSRCNCCGCLRPLKRDRPELGNDCPHGIEELTGEEREAALKELE